jgi:plasmid replication initiation protein
MQPVGVALFEPLIIDAREIIADSNLKGESAFSELQKATMSMIQHVCRIAEKDGLLQTGLISSAKYLTGKGQIRIHIDPALHPYLLRVKKHFSGEQLQSLIKFKSYYSQCFYEWFSKSAKREKVIYISLYALRTMLRIEEQEYERYYDLKRFVIGQAGKELKGTPFEFTFKEKRSGRKVIGLQFYLAK